MDISIAIVEDNHDIRNALEQIIEMADGYSLAGSYNSGEDALLKIPHKMKVFSWEGEKDTVMSVLDSIKYMRMFLETGFIAVDPKNGFVKAWVGGINYNRKNNK